jgi:hypothetical protein
LVSSIEQANRLNGRGGGKSTAGKVHGLQVLAQHGNIGVGTLLGKEQNPSLGIQEPDASESTELVVATDQRRRNDRVCVSRQPTIIKPVSILVGMRR